MLIQYLNDELRRRKDRNPSYSLRSFAGSLKLDSSTLSGLLKGKRKLTPKYREHITSILNLNDKCFSESLAKLQTIETPLDKFNMIADWQHITILGILKSSKKSLTTNELAKALHLQLTEVRKYLLRLEKINYVYYNKNQKNWTLKVLNTTTTSDIPNEAIKECHRQHIHKSALAIDTQGVLERDISGVTFPMPIKSLPRAKKMIAQFRKKFCETFESEMNNDEVYRLNIQIFKIADSIK